MATWFDSIIRWVRKKLGRKRASKRPQVIKRYYSDKCAILELHRNTPSARATYRILPTDGGFDYLATLDALRELEGEMVGEFEHEVVFLRSHPHPVGSTHRFAFWRIRRNSGSTHCIGCWDMDLEFQGSGSAAANTLAPKRVVDTSILRLLKLDNTQRLGEKIEEIDWVRLIANIAKQYAPHHHVNAIAVTFVSEGNKEI